MSGGSVGNGKRRMPEIDLVPILDAMTSVIFFLILSSAFIELTKLTVPPAKMSTTPSTSNKNPLMPKIFILVDGGQMLTAALVWSGENPGKLIKQVVRESSPKKSANLENAVKELTAQLATKFPEEKSLEIGISGSGTYQELISLMDGVRSRIQDIVLISPSEENYIRSRL